MSKKSKYLPEDKEYFILVTFLIVVSVLIGASLIHFFIHIEDNIDIIKSIYHGEKIVVNLISILFN